MIIARTIMLQGTASDVGKSVLATALCRIFVQDGWKVAPYKSQNMALNSYVTPDSKEIGRAQGVQAEACGIAATTDMNPILIKPTGDMAAQIVVHGKPLAEMDGWSYREKYLPLAAVVVKEALERLRATYDVVVIEGAGSPAEINLKDRDIVNMQVAKWADAPVILVSDIDRGGVFASIIGTLELLDEHERNRIKGFIINKFRGDIKLLQPGLDWLEQRTGLPVLGVIPYLSDLNIEAEDSIVLDNRRMKRNVVKSDVDIAVIRLPRISNFTDFDPLEAEPDVSVRFVDHVNELGEPDIIIIPGSKNTLEDLAFLRKSNLDKAIRTEVNRGSQLIGICGGYQMLGRKLCDPYFIESKLGEMDGLAYLPLETTFYQDKRTERVAGTIWCEHPDWSLWKGSTVEGYEIHMGRTEMRGAAYPLFRLGDEWEGTLSEDGAVWGTYLHGIFHNDGFRRAWLNKVRLAKGISPIETVISFKTRQDQAFDRLADHVRAQLNVHKLYEIMGIRS